MNATVQSEKLTDGSIVFNVMQNGEIVAAPPSQQEAIEICAKINSQPDKATAKQLGKFGYYNYVAITPQADTEKLANATARIMFRHLRNNERGIETFFAKKGELNAGWVIEIVDAFAMDLTNQSEHAALEAVAEAANMLTIWGESQENLYADEIVLQKALANLAAIREQKAGAK